MSDLTLYQIHDELEAWSNSLDLAESDDERAEIQARISEYLQMGRAKVDRFSAFLAHLEAQADLCRAEEKRIDGCRTGSGSGGASEGPGANRPYRSPAGGRFPQQPCRAIS